MSEFKIPFQLKLKEPQKSKLYIHVKPTDDYASVKTSIEQATKKYKYKIEFEKSNKDWVFEISNLNSMYQHFIKDVVKHIKVKSITSDLEKGGENLYIDFILPNKHLHGKYKLSKYDDPEYRGELKPVDTIIDKMMHETFKNNLSKDVYKVDDKKYGIGYDLFNIDKMTINDWRRFYHKLYFLQQVFMDLKIKVRSDDKNKRQLVKCLQDPDLLFKGKNSIEFEYSKYNPDVNNVLNKIVKRIVKRDEYFKDLPETDNYNESRRFITKNPLTEKQNQELKRLVNKYTKNIHFYVNEKSISI